MEGGLTLHGCGTALDGEQDGKHSVGNAVVNHVAFPFDFDAAATAAVYSDTVHDDEACRLAVNLLISLLLAALTLMHAVRLLLLAVHVRR